MEIRISNVADVSNKNVRLLKWKLYNLAEKFKDLLYVEAFINSEGKKPTEYKLQLRLGIPGHDIILSKKSANLLKCIHQIDNTAHLQLSEAKKLVSI